MIKKELKNHRLEKGFTQQKLAYQLGMDKTSYCKREKGVIDFSLEEIKKIVKVLNMSEKDIIRIFFEDKVVWKTTFKSLLKAKMWTKVF